MVAKIREDSINTSLNLTDFSTPPASKLAKLARTDTESVLTRPSREAEIMFPRIMVAQT